jgi:hypothetical protein
LDGSVVWPDPVWMWWKRSPFSASKLTFML